MARPEVIAKRARRRAWCGYPEPLEQENRLGVRSGFLPESFSVTRNAGLAIRASGKKGFRTRGDNIDFYTPRLRPRNRPPSGFVVADGHGWLRQPCPEYAWPPITRLRPPMSRCRRTHQRRSILRPLAAGRRRNARFAGVGRAQRVEAPTDRLMGRNQTATSQGQALMVTAQIRSRRPWSAPSSRCLAS